jgi:hypothetical protein
MGSVLWVTGVLVVAGGLLALAVWAARGLAEDRAQQAANNELYEWNQARKRAAPAAVVAARVLEAEAGPDWRLPGYADPFPGPGLMAADLDEYTLTDVPRAGAPRSAPSPVDLDPDVRRMCDETAVYVAELIARTRHAERTHPW